MGKRVLALAVLSLGLLGMGGLGGTRDSGLPARDFRAVLTDVDGTRLEVDRLTAGGDTSLEGELGRGRLRVPFDNVSSVAFERLDGERERVRAKVALREREPVDLIVRGATTFYGQTPGGVFQIRARDLRSIELAPH
jgi:hypothetical protein